MHASFFNADLNDEQQDDSEEGSRTGLAGKVLAGIGVSALAASLIWLRSPSSQALQETLPPPQVMQQVSPASLEMKVRLQRLLWTVGLNPACSA